jgi:RIO kinase 1
VPDSAYQRRGKWRFDDDRPSFAKRDRHRRRLRPLDEIDVAGGLSDGQRWSTWDQSSPTERGPRPHPDWLVTELAATDTELGILKTGKEADVFLVRRGVPGTDRSCLLAAKRYRSAEHRLFHRDSQYLEGRRVRESRASRAMAGRSAVGLQMIAEQWAQAEFSALCHFRLAGVPVPYPVQVLGTEVLLEFIGTPGGAAAPRLAECGLRGGELAEPWKQLVDAMGTLARLGLAHGDLSAYNVLAHDGQLVIIDTPQVVDVIANPRGTEFLDRDAANVASWFAARHLPRVRGGVPGPDELAAFLRMEAGLS